MYAEFLEIGSKLAVHFLMENCPPKLYFLKRSKNLLTDTSRSNTDIYWIFTHRIIQIFTGYNPHVYTKDPSPLTPHVMRRQPWGSRGLPAFAATKHAKTNAKQMSSQSLPSVRHLTPVCIQTLGPQYMRVHTHLMNHSYFDYRKNLKTSNSSPMPE